MRILYFRALITYENGFDKHREIELLKQLCEMSFETEIKRNQLAADESCCACDEAVYEVFINGLIKQNNNIIKSQLT